jgi:hypothetical protein
MRRGILVMGKEVARPVTMKRPMTATQVATQRKHVTFSTKKAAYARYRMIARATVDARNRYPGADSRKAAGPDTSSQATSRTKTNQRAPSRATGTPMKLPYLLRYAWLQLTDALTSQKLS